MSANEEIIIRAILAGTREYLANSQQVVAGNEEIAASTEATGRAMEGATKRGFLMNQALFTVRRLMYGVSLATIASGVAAVKWGFDFNSAMQSARVALSPLQSATFNVNEELDYLFNFTKYTPFQFKDITIAFRQMYGAMAPLGVTANDVNGYIKAMVDALSFAGRTTPGALNRVAVALQHVAFQGHLTGQAVTQLARDGLPIYAALTKELGLTSEQMHQVGSLGIPTQVALKALHDYIESTPGFMNAAHRQAINTFHGLFTTFKDNTAQIMGYVEKGWFASIQNNLASMNKWFDRIGRVARSSGGDINAIMYAIGGPNAVLLWQRVVGVIHQFWLAFVNISGAIARSHVFWLAVYGVLNLIYGILYALNPFLQVFGGTIVGLLIPALIAWYSITKLAAFWEGALTLETVLATKATKELSFWQFLAAVATGKYEITARLAAISTNLMTTAFVEWNIAGFTASGIIAAITTRLALMRAAFYAEAEAAGFAWVATFAPIAGVALAIGGLIALVVVLNDKWKEFHDIVSGNWIQRVTGTSNTGGGGKVQGGGIVGNFLTSRFGAPGWLTGAHRIPGQAAGGVTMAPGLSWVGEYGPELLALPVGATVVPRAQALSYTRGMPGGGPTETKIIRVQIGRKTLVDIVAEEVAAQQARA